MLVDKGGLSHRHLEAAVLASVGGHVTVVAAEHFEFEAPRQTHVGHKLQRRGVIPDIDHIGFSPPVCHIVIITEKQCLFSSLTACKVEMARLLIKGE